MDRILPKINDSNKLYSAMRYSVFAPAKHLRPFLAAASSWIFGVNTDKLMQVAAAIEFVHVYSLIHDDLPSMDNSDFRRGQLSCHKKFDEATAILAGDALLTLAFEVLSTAIESSDKCCRIIKTLSEAIGYNGMIGGQILDIDSNNDEIYKIHLMKTAELFSAACKIGAIIGDASSDEYQALSSYGTKIGLAFQVKDDLADYLQNNEVNNIVHLLGLDNAKEYMSKLLAAAADHLNIFSGKAGYLYDLTKLIGNLQ